jgi:hypothetical protein
MTPCMTKILSVSLLAAAVSSAGTYAGATLTQAAPAAASSYVCPQGITSAQCGYLTDIAISNTAIL